MNEFDIEVVKEKYTTYKMEHYEDEREMRKLLKMKKLVPTLVTEEKWKKDYKRLNDDLADGLYYYNELKQALPEQELKKFIDKVKFKVLKQRYQDFNLNQFDNTFDYKLEENNELDREQKVIPKVEQFNKRLFAQAILEEKELIKKVELVCKYQKSTLDVFFDITSVLKAELARLFVEQMNIEEVNTDEIMTACLVYAFKRTNSPMERERIKKEKEEDKKFLSSLGFDEDFCKICGEYNRYNEPENYIRENEGNILELIDKFVGLIMHREDRLAFPVEEALDLLSTKLLNGIQNSYQNQFIEFVQKLEKIEVSRDIGVVTYMANTANQKRRNDFSGIVEMIMKIRELLGGAVNEHKVMRLEKLEKLQDKFAIVQTLQKMITKTKEKIASMSNILKGYKKLSEGSREEEMDR